MRICLRLLIFVLVLQMGILPTTGWSNPSDGRNDSQDYSPMMSLGGLARDSQSFRGGQPSFHNGRRDGGGETFRGILAPEAILQTVTYQVHILGEVGNPGTYKMAASDRILTAIYLAGGITDNGSERRVELRRGKRTTQIDLLKLKIEGDLQNNPFLLDNDVIYVPLRQKTVRIVGPVRRPDTYELRDEKTVKELLALVGGYTVGVSKKDPLRVVRYQSGKKEVSTLPPFDDQELSSFELQDGDVIVVPHTFLEANEFDYSLAKMPGDNIFYPSYEDRVFVLGGVYSPGPYEFNQNYSVRHYLTLAGGTTKMAKKKILIMGADGKKKRFKKENMIINPGDTILVDFKRIPPEGWLGITASILGITTTVLNIVLLAR